MYEHYSTKQQGVALVISLIMLLLMTLLAISSMNTTILEEKMAGNYKDRNMAFQAAEAGVRAGETYLRTTPVLPVFDGTTLGLYKPTVSGSSQWERVVWTKTSNEVREYLNSLSNVAAKPLYIIEELLPVNDTGGSLEAGVALENRYYRITSQAVGGTDTAVVMLQTTYKR
ncbi:MAG: type IV pilus assembly protein PilX [Methylophagaceae bacterium]|jgi:type IV pilus assembly protein PilX